MSINLSQAVRSCQEHPEDSALRVRMRQETMRLFYQKPVEMGLIKEETASSFLLFVHPTIDHYIDAYDGSVPYERFISHIARMKIRCFQILREEKDQMFNEYNSFYFFQLPEFPDYVADPPSPLSPTDRREVSSEEMPYLFRYLSLVRPARISVREPVLERMAVLLQKETFRRSFLLMMARNPVESLTHYVETFAGMLGVAAEHLADFLAPCVMADASRRIRYRQQEDRVAYRYVRRHGYRNLQVQRIDLFSQYHQEKWRRKEAMNRTIWRHGLENLTHMRSGLSQNAIASLIAINRSSVARLIAIGRQELERTIRCRIDADSPPA